MKEIKKNYGLNLLKIVSMIMILFMHFLGKSTLLDRVELYSINFYVSWFLECLFVVAVNCYVLITGFFSVNKTFNFKRILKLWKNTYLYSIIIGLILVAFGICKFSLSNAFYVLFPIISKAYWFITIYIVLVLFSPFLNTIVCHISQNQYRNLIVISILIFTIIPTFTTTEHMVDINGGTGLIWFSVLYLIGGYMSKYCNLKNVKSPMKKYIFYSLVLYFIKLSMTLICTKYGFDLNQSNKWFLYNVIFVLFSSINLFIFFERLDVKNLKIQKFIDYITPCVISIYIIHEHPLLSKVLYTDILHLNLIINEFYAIPLLFVLAIFLFFICIIIDKVFQKFILLLGKTKFLNLIKEKIFILLSFFYNLFKKIQLKMIGEVEK